MDWSILISDGIVGLFTGVGWSLGSYIMLEHFIKRFENVYKKKKKR